MKVYTIAFCGQCPMYDPNRMEYTNDGECLRLSRQRVWEYKNPPANCPLKDWEGEQNGRGI
jgi:hypothetical protein